MILCIDVGNSHIHGGVFKKNELLLQFRYPSDENLTSDQLGVFFRQTLRENNVDPAQINHVAICSVVPSMDYSMRSAFIKYFDTEPFLLQPGVKTGLKIKSKNPQEVGSDRIANGIAAIELYPKKNIVVVDFGTATTFDVINSKAEYLGGAILPGLKVSMHALHMNAAKLAPVQLVKPKQAIGQTTISNIQSGLYYGQVGALREFLTRIKQEAFAQEDFHVIGTGGFAYLFETEALFDTIVADLVLQGLRFTLLKNRKN